MILPTKHTTIEQSLLGFGAYILRTMGDGVTIDDLWVQYQKDFANGDYNAKHSFDNLLLTIAFLFSIGAVDENSGRIEKCN